jgi:Glycosyl transferases group 1
VPRKVLYLTVVPIHSELSGGAIVCRQHIKCLSKIDGIKLTVAGLHGRHWPDPRPFLKSLGVECKLLDWDSGLTGSLPSKWDPAYHWPFPFEASALSTSGIDFQVGALLDSVNPDVVIVDYVFTALFIPCLYRRAARRVVISLNREEEMFADLRRLKRLPDNVADSHLTTLRLGVFERWVFNNSNHVVALTANDLPESERSEGKYRVIQPVLDRKNRRWNYKANKRLFFVGSKDHYPNYLAMKWLGEQLGPQLLQKCPEAQIHIIGAASGDVPEKWQGPNVKFLGSGTRDDVEANFCESDLFIAPIENN